MKNKLLVGLAVGGMMSGMAGVADPTLITIGKASYGGSDYNLIWDNDNNGNSVVWGLTYNIDTAYTFDWGDWRLPDTVDEPYQWGYDGNTTTTFNITSSEMGHLYYEELGNLGCYDDFGSCSADWVGPPEHRSFRPLTGTSR